MPIVETSVAVATPSTTAARITNGNASAGNAIDERAADLAARRALDGLQQLLAAIAPPSTAHSAIASTTAAAACRP